jgi:hypothetical protein
VLEREHGRRGGVVQMDPRGEAASVTDDRELSLAHRLDEAVVGRAVEDAVAKYDPAGVPDRLVEVRHRGGGLQHPGHRGWIERIVLCLDRSASALIEHAGEALRDEPGGARFTRGCQERIGALRAQPVRLDKALVQVPRELDIRQRCRFMDDRVGLRREHRTAHGGRVEEVERDRLGAERAYAFSTLGRGGRADHVVSSLDQLGNEPGANRAARSGYEDSHRILLSSHHGSLAGLRLRPDSTEERDGWTSASGLLSDSRSTDLTCERSPIGCSAR